METKHTPGPWSKSWIRGGLRHLNRNVDYENFWTPDEGEDRETANIPSYYGNTGDVDLIAAAPELLAACKQLLIRGSFDGNDGDAFSAVAMAKAAIAKATAEPVPA